ncbi:DUF1735 domain-containing protein [Ferruginibacter paludis]|uniref:DUF1735 domain-containing protein n=1 Tax=Ferruginibacter paludis TaxID=1310417 RepID=UPI0025B3EB06|nr:DUF1735 domain-containing protein [Ferruginibacter paludis]MDN3658464.1 DUF1735 domain-containing protein [Ferruginibacter paludis]
MKIFKVKYAFAILIASLSMASCLKKGDMNIDPDKTTAPIMELQYLQAGNNTINSGLQNFASAGLTYKSTDLADTANYNISLAGPITFSKDLNVTIAVDPSKLMDNLGGDSINYELMPDSTYHLVSTAAVIKAGQTIAPMQVVFYPSKISVLKSYMLPLTIKDAEGNIVSSNFGTIYFHAIGNPIAGSYTREYTRYNNFDGTGIPVIHSITPSTFSPISPKSVSALSGAAGLKYIISFTDNNGVLSNFKVKFDAESVAKSGVAIVGDITIVTADPVAHKFEFNFHYDNLAGGLRNLTDKFY